jgi:Heparinase II/III N-terminus
MCDGRFRFLGQDWPCLAADADEPLQFPPTFWFHDPITGKAWPDAAASSFDVDVRATGADIGDVKYVWEPNRLQMLHPLAAVIAATPASGPLRVATAIISSWMIANPPYRGVNWKSGIELALRLVSLTLFVAAARPATLSVAQRVMIRAMVLAHARYLAAFPSLHSSANNHRIAEGLGLFVAGVLLPDLAEARAWLDEGRRIIETEATRQILADGVGAEQSPTYQAFSMEMTALAARLAADLHVPLDPRVTERLVRGAEYLSWLSDQNGFVPAIGDDDLGLSSRSRWITSRATWRRLLLRSQGLPRARIFPFRRMTRIYAMPFSTARHHRRLRISDCGFSKRAGFRLPMRPCSAATSISCSIMDRSV